MRLKFIPKPIEWDEVREEILKTIEEEERRDKAAVVPCSGESIVIEVNQKEQESEQTVRMTSADDYGLPSMEGVI